MITTLSCSIVNKISACTDVPVNNKNNIIRFFIRLILRFNFNSTILKQFVKHLDQISCVLYAHPNTIKNI